MKTITHIHRQVSKDFITGACTPLTNEVIIYFDAGYLPLHTTKTLELIQSSDFKFSLN